MGLFYALLFSNGALLPAFGAKCLSALSFYSGLILECIYMVQCVFMGLFGA